MRLPHPPQYKRACIGQVVEMMLLALNQVGWNGDQLAPSKLHTMPAGSASSHHLHPSTQPWLVPSDESCVMLLLCMP